MESEVIGVIGGLHLTSFYFFFYLSSYVLSRIQPQEDVEVPQWHHP